MTNTSVYSTTLDQKYFSFIDVTTKAWQRINYDTSLIVVGQNSAEEVILEQIQNGTHTFRRDIDPPTNTVFLSADEYDINGNKAFLSQVSRILCLSCPDDFPSLSKSGLHIISDVDMIPLSRKYFDDMCDVSEKYNSFVVASSDAYKEDRYPMCYLAGTIEHFKQIVNPENLPFKNLVENWYNSMEGNWNTDEIIFTKKFMNWTGNKTMLERGWKNTAFGRIAVNRIDRAVPNENYVKVELSDAIDAHLSRPYEIDKNQDLEYHISYK